MPEAQKYFFSGIGGGGMSAIAQILRQQGHTVHGSDRNFDLNPSMPKFQQLKSQGIRLVPQDGSGINTQIDHLIVSSAIENDNPEIQAAQISGVPVQKRAHFLASMFNRVQGIAIGGTNGKSTVTGMIGHILQRSGKNPTIINGASMRNYKHPQKLGNAVYGDPNLMVIEADESDGSIQGYEPTISVINNISKDHKPIPELSSLFRRFIQNTRDAVAINIECLKYLPDLPSKKIFTFGLHEPDAEMNGQFVSDDQNGICFQIGSTTFKLPLFGRHNIKNAIAATCACQQFGISSEVCASSLTSFEGIARRLQIVGSVNGITVIDDFAHNPDKIYATLSTLKNQGGRLFVMFQPHGFFPTKFLKNELIDSFVSVLRKDDLLLLSDIYYVGGSADTSISSLELVQQIAKAGIDAKNISNRSEITKLFVDKSEAQDKLVIMGARDESLSDFANSILIELQKKHGES